MVISVCWRGNPVRTDTHAHVFTTWGHVVVGVQLNPRWWRLSWRTSPPFWYLNIGPLWLTNSEG